MNTCGNCAKWFDLEFESVCPKMKQAIQMLQDKLKSKKQKVKLPLHGTGVCIYDPMCRSFKYNG